MPNTLFIGKVLVSFDELPSTNDYARALIAGSTPQHPAKSRPPEGLVVRAVSQSAGRGQFGSQWLSAPGANLTFSVVLYPAWLPGHAQFVLSQCVALALHDTVSAMLPPESAVRIKWPNDIYAGHRKLCGILIENIFSGLTYSVAIVGIGLNVNQQLFPPELPAAGSMATESSKTFDMAIVLDTLLENLEHRYLQLRNGHAVEIRSAYLSRLYRLHEKARFERPDGRVFEGTIRDVLPSGHLLLETPEGREAFEVKAIRFV